MPHIHGTLPRQAITQVFRGPELPASLPDALSLVDPPKAAP
jgi:hypothetical protein